MKFSNTLSFKGFIFLNFILYSQAQFSIDIGDFPKCLQRNCNTNLDINGFSQGQYISCLKQNCSIIASNEEENKEMTKEEYATQVYNCFDQCSQLTNSTDKQCQRGCIIDNIEESGGSSSNKFQLNVFLIAISAVVGIIILFVGLVKYAYMRKNRMNRKLPIKVSPQIVTSIPTAVYPAIQLNRCDKEPQPVQGIPCFDKQEKKPAHFKTVPINDNYNRPLSLILHEELYQPKETYYPGKSIEVVPSSTNCDKNLDIPKLQIAQIQINDHINGEQNLEFPHSDTYKEKKSPSEDNQSPFTPINFQYLQPSSINRQNIHVGKLNLSKLSKQKKLSEASTLTFITSKNGQTPRDHQRITSRCEFQNYLIEKSPKVNENIDLPLSFRQLQQQQQNRLQNYKKTTHKRAVSSKSLSRFEIDIPLTLPKNKINNKNFLVKRRSFESN